MSELIEVSWNELKSSMESKKITNRLQWIKEDSSYNVFLFDGPLKLTSIIKKTNPKNSDQHEFESYYKKKANQVLHISNVIVSESAPFGSKKLTDGKRLFRRVHGISREVHNGPDNIDFTVPFSMCKITGVQILGAKLGDKANFKVLDTDQGFITGVPNYELNQFGFDVNIIPDVATYPSRYDADLIGGMILRIEYDAVDELLPRVIYVNFDLHEIKV